MELAKAVVRIESDISDLDAGLALAQEAMAKAGKTLEDLGKQMTVKVTLPILALGALSVKEFGEQEDAIAKVNAVLAATGGVSNTTTAEILHMADSMQGLTRFSNDAIVSAAGLLLTFQNVRNELGAGNQIFDRAIHDVADLSAVMGNDLQTATMQLGRALQEPATGLQLLRRAGIQFSTTEQEQIKRLVEHGNALEAQRLILEKVESKTKDAAKAMADTPTGHFIQAWNAVKDSLKGVGAIIDTVLVPLADMAKNLAIAFKDLEPGIKAIVVALAAVAASIGPVLLGLGLLGKAIAGIKAGLALLGLSGGVVVLVIAALAAVGVAIYELVTNWDTLKLKTKLIWLEIVFSVQNAIAEMLNALADLPGGVGEFFSKAHARMTDAMHATAVELAKTNADIRADLLKSGDVAVEAGQKFGKARLAHKPVPPGWAADVGKAFNTLNLALEASDKMVSVLGNTFDNAGSRASAYQSAIQSISQTTIGLDDSLNASNLHFGDMIDALHRLDPALDTTHLTLRQLIDRWHELTIEAGNEAFKKNLEGINEQAAILGDRFDSAAAIASAYAGRVQELINAHTSLDAVIDKNGTTLRQLIGEMQTFEDAAKEKAFEQNLEGINEQAEVLGVRFNSLDAKAAAYASRVQELINAHVKLDDVIDQNGTTLRQFIKEMQNLQDKAAVGTFIRDEFGKASDAIVDFAFGAKQTIGDFLRQVMADFAKLILRIELMKLLVGIGGSSSSGGGASDAGVGENMGAFATGGFLSPGEFGIVGEAGPEVIQAGRSGATISPISEARGTAGNPASQGSRMTVPVTVNVNTIDSQGVADFFTKNQDIVAATFIKAAQRSKLIRGSMG